LAKLPPIDGCEYSLTSLDNDLKNAYSVVTFNSNSAVEAIIKGVRVFAADNGSMAWNVAKKNLSDLEDPIFIPDRRPWLNDLCYAQWTPAEIAEGKAWRHLFAH